MSPSRLQRCAAEAAGTALLVGIGTAAIVAGARAGGVPQWVLAVAWFGAVAIPVFAFARWSGSHINPAVTLMLVLGRRFPAGDAGPYMAAQVLGAFVGSAIVLAVLGDYGHLGATLPRNDDLALTFVLEFVATFALMLSVVFLTTPGRDVRAYELLLPPVIVGLATLLIGPWTGSSLNPARSLAPGVLSGDLTGLWVYFLAATFAAGAAGWLARAQTRPGASSR